MPPNSIANKASVEGTASAAPQLHETPAGFGLTQNSQSHESHPHMNYKGCPTAANAMSYQRTASSAPEQAAQASVGSPQHIQRHEFYPQNTDEAQPLFTAQYHPRNVPQAPFPAQFKYNTN